MTASCLLVAFRSVRRCAPRDHIWGNDLQLLSLRVRDIARYKQQPSGGSRRNPMNFALPLHIIQVERTMRLRTPLAVAVGRKLRICIVARFSTDEQKKRRRSNAAQIKYVQKQIEIELQRAGITAYEFIIIADEAVSGERKERPGIAMLRGYIDELRIDVIVGEDSSRLYRNYAFCHEIVAGAFDQGIRTIFFNDDVDTADQDWEQRLQEAQAHHCKDNAYTRRRIARAFEDLWEMGAAVGPLRSGHLRSASKAATVLSEAEGPFFDALDPAHVKHIACAFKIVKRGHDLEIGTRYLTKKGVPLCNGKIGAWKVRHLIAMIRNPIYRGQERFRVTKTKQIKLTGESKQEKRDASEVWWRPMPHLRIASDGLWSGANSGVDARRKCDNPPKGKDHPHFRVPRDSRTPTSGLMYCGICTGKMYCIGTCYRCECVHRKRGAGTSKNTCWNHATCPREFTDEQIYGRALQELLDTEGKLDVLVDGLAQMLADRGQAQANERHLQREIEGLQRKCRNLQAAIEGRERQPKTIVDQILAHEDDIEKKLLELEEVRSELLQAVEVPNRSQLLETLRATMLVIPGAGRQARELLKDLLADRIEVFPYRLLNSDRIVLRAHFVLNLVNICPEELRQGLRLNLDWARNAAVMQVPCVVDLFETPRYVKNAVQVHEALKTSKVSRAGWVRRPAAAGTATRPAAARRSAMPSWRPS